MDVAEKQRIKDSLVLMAQKIATLKTDIDNASRAGIDTRDLRSQYDKLKTQHTLLHSVYGV